MFSQSGQENRSLVDRHWWQQTAVVTRKGRKGGLGGGDGQRQSRKLKYM